jgi:hypothetical protein
VGRPWRGEAEAVTHYTKRDIEQMCRRVHLDLSDAQAKVRELMRVVSSLPIPEAREDYPQCPRCGLVSSVHNESQLTEHMENVHGAAA